MTPELFIQELQQIFDKTLKDKQLPLYLDKLRRFSSEQLIEILNKTLEEAKYFPKVSEIFKAAEGLGYLSIDLTKCRVHHWRPTDCSFCRGEGRIAVIWHCFYEERNEQHVEIQELVQIFPYSKSFEYQFKPNEVRSIFRCKCLAGEADSIPKAWPKWTRESNTRREVWA